METPTDKNSSENSPSTPLPQPHWGRRSFVQMVGTGLAAAALARAADIVNLADQNAVKLSPLSAPTEADQPPSHPSAPPAARVGFAIVGLGRLALEQLLPAFGECKFAFPAALVSGDRTKAEKIARQYGIKETEIFDYSQYERLADLPEVKVIYIVLPNGLHAEYTIRGARVGKHILCEKPMANSSAECLQMIAACQRANVKLMIAYRSQYEPFDQAIVEAVKEKKLGQLREFVSANSQNQGDPSQWRLNHKLAGGGPLPDVGIYCINAARFLSGEEPTEVFGQTVQMPNDPRFREVEASAQFILRFPSGFTASCSCSYDSHRAQFLRLQGSDGWAELDPAFAYRGLRLRLGQKVGKHNVVTEPAIEAKNQFAAEIDHLAECVTSDQKPHTPGEEGLQDLRIIEAIYESARTGRVVKLATPPTTRNPLVSNRA
jgi:predicted dehydrogenase